MADGGITLSLAEAAMGFYYRVVEPAQFAWRRQSRLDHLGVRDLAELPVAAIDLDEHRPECGEGCRIQIDVERAYLDRFLFRDSYADRALSRWRGVACVIDLDAFPDAARYAAKIAGRTGQSGAMRDIKKARARGYYVKPISRATHFKEMVEIQSSKLFRTGGLVIAALPGVGKAMSSARRTDRNECSRHWGGVWGALVAEAGDDGVVHEKLAAYCHMRRVGNRIHSIALMGHGAHIGNGVVKLLYFEIIKWLLDRQDPRIIGVRYVHAGAIEQGREASLKWKRQFQFKPYIFTWKHAGQ